MTQAADQAGTGSARPEGFRRVAAALAAAGHAQAPRWLETPARSSADAARALGVAMGQIAKSVVLRRLDDGAAVLVVAAGDRRVDEAKVARLVGAVGRADAAFVKQRTGFSIGGVAPLAHQPQDGGQPPLLLVDASLLRFAQVWAAAGHPNGVFCLRPAELLALTGSAPADLVEAA